MFPQIPVTALPPLCSELEMEADGIYSPICVLIQDTMTIYALALVDNAKATGISQQNKTP